MAKEKIVIEFTHPGEPLTKANAHIFRRKGGKGTVFIPKRISEYETGLHDHAKTIMGRKQPTKSLVSITIHYYYGSKRRKDIQNLSKTQCDALNNVVYVDDSQIHEIHEYKHLDRKNPRVVIKVCEITDPSWENE